MGKYDLSVLIPAKNEMFLQRTIEEVNAKKRGNTETIVVLDGYWPDEPIPDHPDVTLIHLTTGIGQRAGTNLAARVSESKFIMKLDAHCALDEGFDVKLMSDCEYDWTVVPRMYNLHAFSWRCKVCGNEWYQGPVPIYCCSDWEGKEKNLNCTNTSDFERVIKWEPRLSRMNDFMRFDRNLKFQYWGSYNHRPESKGDIVDLMCNLGACWFMHRERYWDLGGMDEGHGSWGQMGVEVSCKAWLSGGRQVVNKKTWFSHMFRTQGGTFGFPYAISGNQTEFARKYSRDLWENNKWDKAVRPLQWIIDKFQPPEWVPSKTKGIAYYTDNGCDKNVLVACQKQLKKIKLPINSCSLGICDLGQNVIKDWERGDLTMFRQILNCLEASEADIVFLCEHDVLYHKSHFDFEPIRKDIFYYNTNVWKVRYEDGHSVRVNDCKQTSGLVAFRSLLIEHYRKRIKLCEQNGFSRKMGYEPGTHGRAERIDDYKCETFESKYPNLDIRHDKNLTSSRWSPEEFRNKKFAEGWTEATEIDGWGETKKLMDRMRNNKF